MTSLETAYPELDIDRNWHHGARFEKKIAEQHLYFFSEWIIGYKNQGFLKRLCGDYHWDMCERAIQVEWCHSCKFIDKRYPANKPVLCKCRLTNKAISPFEYCQKWESRNGRKLKPSEGGYIRKINLYPRESMKTSILSVNYIVWCLCQDMNYNFLVLTQTSKLAKKILGAVKRIILTNKKIRTYWPYLYKGLLNSDKNTEDYFYLARNVHGAMEPTVEAAQIGGALEGGHFHETILDDPTGDNNRSEKGVRNTINGYTASLPLRIKNFEKQRINATRWTPDDLIYYIKKNFGHQWDIKEHEMCYIVDEENGRFWEKGKRCRQVEPDDVKRYISQGHIDDEIVVPYEKWFSKKKVFGTIEENKTDIFFLFCQYFNRPTGDSTLDFDTTWFKHKQEKEIIDIHKGGTPWELMNTYAMIDLSPGSDSSGTSSTAMKVISVDHWGYYYLRYSFSAKLTILQSIEKVIQLTQKYKPRTWTCELGKDYGYFRPVFDKVVEETQEAIEEQIIEAQHDNRQNIPEFFEPPDGWFYEISRAGSSALAKKLRIIRVLQPIYESGKFIHVGDANTHEMQEHQLIHIAELPNYSIDEVDACADIHEVVVFPNKDEVEQKKEIMLYNAPQLGYAESAWEEEMRWAMEQREKEEAAINGTYIDEKDDPNYIWR